MQVHGFVRPFPMNSQLTSPRADHETIGPTGDNQRARDALRRWQHKSKHTNAYQVDTPERGARCSFLTGLQGSILSLRTNRARASAILPRKVCVYLCAARHHCNVMLPNRVSCMTNAKTGKHPGYIFTRNFR
jgi:hypothetical protein